MPLGDLSGPHNFVTHSTVISLVSTHYHLTDSHNHDVQAVQLSDADIRQLQDEVDMLRRENAALRQQLGKMALSDALAQKNGQATMVRSLYQC